MSKFLMNKRNSIILSIIAMLLWGSAIPVIKSTYKVLEIQNNDTGAKIFVAGIRFFIAGIITFIYLGIFKKEKLSKNKIDMKLIIIMSFVQTSIQYLFYYIGLSYTSGVKASIIQATNAFMIVILARVFIPSEKITKRQIIALIIGTISIFIINIQKGFDLSIKFSGEGFIIIATAFNALVTILLRKYGKEQNTFILSGGQFLLGSLPLIIIGLFTQKMDLTINISAFILLLYGGFISATAFSIWGFVLKYQNASDFAIYKLFIPIFGALLSIIILKEHLTLNLIVGLFLVLFGTYILNKKDKN